MNKVMFVYLNANNLIPLEPNENYEDCMNIDDYYKEIEREQSKYKREYKKVTGIAKSRRKKVK